MRISMLVLSISLAVCYGGTATQLAAQETTSHYWKWGWGTYDASPDERNIAIFDWSFIHVGNQSTISGRCVTTTS